MACRLTDIIAGRVHDGYITACETLPCGHAGVCWYGWKQDGRGGYRLSLSLESHIVLRCFQCGAIVPLGAATDTAETAVEVTAARIIADDFAYWPVMDGFDAWVEDRDDDGVRQHHDHPFFQAGWLACAIAHHATEHGEG
jgi:hypothetical protein